jgi:hypothetical protein
LGRRGQKVKKRDLAEASERAKSCDKNAQNNQSTPIRHADFMILSRHASATFADFRAGEQKLRGLGSRSLSTDLTCPRSRVSGCLDSISRSPIVKFRFSSLESRISSRFLRGSATFSRALSAPRLKFNYAKETKYNKARSSPPVLPPFVFSFHPPLHAVITV